MHRTTEFLVCGSGGGGGWQMSVGTSGWEVTAPGGLSLDSLRRVYLSNPRSGLAKIFALLSTTNSAVGASATVDGKNILRAQILRILATYDSEEDSKLIQELYRVAYNVHHPMNTLDPARFSDEDPSVRGAYIALMPTDQVTEAFGTSVSCPRWADNSCFSDTLFVVMFIATDKYDAAFLAHRPPGALRSTLAESDLTDVGDEIDEACTDPLEGKDFDDASADRKEFERGEIGKDELQRRREMRAAAKRWRQGTAVESLLSKVRAVAWGMRARPSPEKTAGTLKAEVGKAMHDLRVEMDKCAPQERATWASSPNEPLELYFRILAATGWARWYMAIPTSVGYKNVPVVRERPRIDMTANVASGAFVRLSGPFRFPPDGVPLQESIDYSLGTTIVEKEKVFPVGLPPREIDNPHIDFLTSPPKSGILVLRAPSSFDLVTEIRTRVQIRIPADRLVTIPFGRPQSEAEQRVEYRVFAVIQYVGRAHYTCYFWRNDILFYYNDLGTDSPQVVTDVAAALESIRVSGINFFLERVDEDGDAGDEDEDEDEDESGFDSDGGLAGSDDEE